MNLLAPGTTFQSLITSLIGLMNTIIPVLIAAAVVFLFFGIVRYVRSQGEKHRQEIVWSLVALFVILSVWGILRLGCATLTSSASCDSATNYNEPTGLYNTSGPPANGGIYPI